MSARGQTLSRLAANPVRRRRTRLTGGAAVLAAVVLLLAAMAIVPLRQYLRQKSEIVGLERRVAALEEERERLESRIRSLRDPEVLERLARKCLGMVRRGETAFVVVPEGGAPRSPDC